MDAEVGRWEPERAVGGRYRVEQFLDEGAAGEVYAGTNTWTGRKVAIKRLHPKLHGTSTLVERFLLEGRIGGLVDHPNIVQTLDMGQEAGDGSFFIIQELLRGVSLRQEMQRASRLSCHEALDWMIPLLGAVAAVHQHGIVHRDIKPENVMIADTSMGHRIPKLLDFGIAKVPRSQTFTCAGSLLGTVDYMAPEQVEGDKDLDRRADVWAVGLLLYELLTGHNPFYAPNAAVALMRILSIAPPPVRDLRPDVPTPIADAVARAMLKDRRERQESVLHFLDDILRWARSADSEEDRSLATRHRISLPAILTQHSMGSGYSIAPSSARVSLSMAPRHSGQFQVLGLQGLAKTIGAPLADLAVAAPDTERPSEGFEEANASDDGEPSGGGVASADEEASAASTDELVAQAYTSLRNHAFTVAYNAAEQALAGMPNAVESRARLRLLQSEAAYWLAQNVHHDQCALDAFALAPPRSRPWLQAIGEIASSSSTLGVHERLPMLAEELAEPATDPATEPDYLIACCRVGIALQRAGWPELVESVLGRLQPEIYEAAERSPLARAWLALLRSELADHAGDHAHSLALTESAVAAFQEAGDVRRACAYRADIGNGLLLLGGYEEAEQILEATWNEAQGMGLAQASTLQLNLGLAQARQGKTVEGQECVVEAMRSFMRHGDWRGECSARLYLSEILWLDGHRDSAEREAKAAVDVASVSPVIQAEALGMLSIVIYDRPVESLMAASQAMELLQSAGGVAEGEARIRLAYGMALERLGREEQARVAFREAAERLLARAKRISDEGLRDKFLHVVSDHARTLELNSARTFGVVDDRDASEPVPSGDNAVT